MTSAISASTPLLAEKVPDNKKPSDLFLKRLQIGLCLNGVALPVIGSIAGLASVFIPNPFSAVGVGVCSVSWCAGIGSCLTAKPGIDFLSCMFCPDSTSRPGPISATPHAGH